MRINFSRQIQGFLEKERERKASQYRGYRLSNSTSVHSNVKLMTHNRIAHTVETFGYLYSASCLETLSPSTAAYSLILMNFMNFDCSLRGAIPSKMIPSYPPPNAQSVRWHRNNWELAQKLSKSTAPQLPIAANGASDVYSSAWSIQNRLLKDTRIKKTRKLYFLNFNKFA